MILQQFWCQQDDITDHLKARVTAATSRASGVGWKPLLGAF